MKCAIFCLLAFCAFQTVFADELPKEVHSPTPRHKTLDKFSDVLNKLYNPVWDAANAIKQKDLLPSDIVYTCEVRGPEYNKFNEDFNTGKNQCNQCYDQAQKTKNMKDAEKCCDKIIVELEKQTKSFVDRALACIKKCAGLGADCKKMIKNPYAECNGTAGANFSADD